MARRAALLLTLLLSPPASAGQTPAAPRRPNIILISIDTLRPDHTGCYGYDRPTTPSLDAFAQDAVLFENAVSAAPWTLPSHSSIFTSLYPNRHGLVQRPKRFQLWKNLRIAAQTWRAEGWPGLTARFLKEPRVKPHRMNSHITTLAEALRRAGYRTAGFAACDNLDGAFGFSRGFEEYDVVPFRPAAQQNALALEWLKRRQGQPSFLFLHYYDAHGNFGREVAQGLRMGNYPVYDAPAETRRLFDDGRRGRFDGSIKTLLELQRSGRFTATDARALNAFYDAGVRSTDEALGRFLSRLKQLRLYDDSVILVTSDHGENLLDQDGEILHHTGLRNTLLRVVCLLKPAGSRGRPRRVRDLVRTIDYMPTLLDAAGVLQDAGLRRQMQGFSLLGPLRTGRFPGVSAYSEVDITGCGFPPTKAIQDSDGWKLVYHPAEHRTELYDLRADPAEKRNLAESHPGRAGRLLEELLRSSGVVQPDAVLPNIVLVSIDSLRADHLGCYGYGSRTSPHLDALADGATLFERHISPSAWTLPAHMSLLTGAYPSYHGLTMPAEPWNPRRWAGALQDALSAAWLRVRNRPVRYGPSFQARRLRPGLQTLPEALRAAGYRTGAFTACSFLTKRYGFARGFDRFVSNPEGTPAHRQNEAALAWLAEKRGPPFFLFLHYYDVHHTLKTEGSDRRDKYPYDCPGPFQKSFLPARLPADFDARLRGMDPARMRQVPPRERPWVAGLYDGCVRRMDEDFGGLLAGLQSLGAYDQTLLVVTSDHGEAFWDRGWWGHGQELFQELIHTPLLVKAPGQREPRRERRFSSGVDVLPIILDAAGVEPSPQLQAQMQGFAPRPPEESGLGNPVFSERDQKDAVRAVVSPDGWKLILDLTGNRRMLFDLSRDPGEKRDLSASQPARLAELEELLQETYSGPLAR
jgi:arylsulfatase A-like enzyme